MKNASAITTICHHHLSRFMGSCQCSYSGTVSELIFLVFAWENKSCGYIMSVWIHAADRSHLFPACTCFLPVCANIFCVFCTTNELDTSTLCIPETRFEFHVFFRLPVLLHDVCCLVITETLHDRSQHIRSRACNYYLDLVWSFSHWSTFF